MKIYAETRNYIRRNAASIWVEDREIRTEKHEISETAYKFFISEILANASQHKNSDGSISYSHIVNYNESVEYTFYFEQ